MPKKSRKNPNNKTTNATEKPNMKEIITEGLVIQRSFYKKVLGTKEFKNQDARVMLEAADERGLDLVIIAGKFDAKRGCFGIIGNDSIAAIGIAAANGRMRELGSSGTVWAVLGDEEFTKKYGEQISGFADSTNLNWRNLH